MIASRYSGWGSPGLNDAMLVVWSSSLIPGLGDIKDAYYSLPNSCSLPDANHNGVVNVDDLLAVIGGWGACVNCNADINGDGVVNVDDLLAVIGGWGPSP
jgi:hypothetical protein